MLDQTVQKYIKEHQLCAEYIFADWEAFLDLLYEHSGRVDSILWFEHVRIIDQKDSLGAGGYRDQADPEYMYAETPMHDGMESKSLSEVKEYIQATLAAYSNHVLIPSFYIDD